MGEVRSNAALVSAHATNISGSVSDVQVDSLAGVDGDNTLAESGVYNSAASLRQTFGTLAQTLVADADRLRNAAAVFDEEDTAIAGSYR